MSKGHYMTANMGYKRDVLLNLNGFDENHYYLSDRDLALRILEHGKIEFCENMVVKHLKKTWTPSRFIKSAIRARDRVRLIKYRNDRVYDVGIHTVPEKSIENTFSSSDFFPNT